MYGTIPDEVPIPSRVSFPSWYPSQLGYYYPRCGTHPTQSILSIVVPFPIGVLSQMWYPSQQWYHLRCGTDPIQSILSIYGTLPDVVQPIPFIASFLSAVPFPTVVPSQMWHPSSCDNQPNSSTHPYCGPELGDFCEVQEDLDCPEVSAISLVLQCLPKSSMWLPGSSFRMLGITNALLHAQLRKVLSRQHLVHGLCRPSISLVQTEPCAHF